MALVGVELETLGSEPDVLTTRPYIFGARIGIGFNLLDFISAVNVCLQVSELYI